MEPTSLTFDTAFWITSAAILGLLVLSGYFSGSETALTAASRGKLRAQADKGSRGAARALQITTPQEHLLHHSTDRPGNYGNLSTLWDRLFGTYQDPRAPQNQDRPLGLPYDRDFLGSLTFGLARFPEAWRRRLTPLGQVGYAFL